MRRSNPGATTCAAPATQTVVPQPLDCFASLRETNWQAASVYGKAESPFHQGGWAEAGAEPANDGSGELRIFLPKNRIVCQVQNSLDLGRCSAMKRASPELYHSSQAMRQKGGGPRRKIWKASKGVWKPCNPLKSHKTAKDLFGKAWSKTREFWRSLEKGLEGAFIPPPLAPAASSLRSRWIVIAREARSLRSNPGVGKRRSNAAVRPAKGGLSVWKSGWPVSSRGAELAMTDRELAHLFLRVALACERPAGDRFAAGRGAPAGEISPRRRRRFFCVASPWRPPSRSWFF